MCGSSTTPPSTTSTTQATAPPASRSTLATRKGTATINRPATAMLTSCTSGFTATVRGRIIKRVVFTLGGKRLGDRTGSPFRVYVAAGKHGIVRARVTFKDATRAKTLTLPYRACAAAVRHPGARPVAVHGMSLAVPAGGSPRPSPAASRAGGGGARAGLRRWLRRAGARCRGGALAARPLVALLRDHVARTAPDVHARRITTVAGRRPPTRCEPSFRSSGMPERRRARVGPRGSPRPSERARGLDRR